MYAYTGGLFPGGYKYSTRLFSLLHWQATILGLNHTLKHLNEVDYTGYGRVHSSYSQCVSTLLLIMKSIIFSSSVVHYGTQQVAKKTVPHCRHTGVTL